MTIENGILYSVTNNDLNSDGSFTFPEGVTNIACYAFSDCSKLKKINIPEGVMRVGKCAFNSCKKLKSVTLPTSLKEIGEAAFYFCFSLVSIAIPDNVTQIKAYTFGFCKSLQNIVIPPTIKSIGREAFSHCEHLRSPKDVYKAFNPDMTCRKYHFRMNEWSNKEKYISLCFKGYHYCTNLFEIFNYYDGNFDEDFIICLCETGNKNKRGNENKFVTNTIKPVRQLTKEEIIKILNGEEI